VPKPSGTAGNLKVLSWAGFKAAVSYNFDDANSSQVSNYSTLEGLGVHFTFYLIGNKISAAQSAWTQAVKDGHEIGNHTQDHNTVAATNVDQGAATIKTDLGVTVDTMAAPNGDTGYDAFAQTRYLLNRGVADGSMLPGNETTPSPFNTYCYIPPANASVSAFNAEVDAARSSGGWRVILVHGFTGGTDGAYQPVALTNYVMGVQYAKTFNDLWIDTMIQVGSYWRGQNAFNKATTSMTSGGGQTWTWTLPANFPKGKYLRVTVSGGTLSQNGAALTWDTHGYYEISLDVGSLTLSP
jgi:hypothetical protein